MTRANLNFVWQNRGEEPRTLFHYHNGDQYPSGIRDSYNVLDLVKEEITPERFKEWIKNNYKEYKRVRQGSKKSGMSIEFNQETEIPSEAEDLGEGGQPKIYFTDGFITDYSYVFEPDEVSVWNWKELIFEGSRKKFIAWIKKQK